MKSFFSPFRFLVKWSLVRPYYALRASNLVWLFLNRKERASYKAHPVSLSLLENRIVNDLMSDGIALAHFDELFPESTLLKEMQEETQRRLPNAMMSDKKEFFLDLFESHPILDFSNPLVRFSLSDALVSVSNAYLKMWSKFYRYRLTGTVVVPRGKDPRFADTSGIHRGGFSTTKQRLMFIAAFSSQHSFGKRIGFDLPKNVSEFELLSEPTRFALGLSVKVPFRNVIKKFLTNVGLLFFVFVLMSVFIEGGYRFIKKTQYAFPKGIFQEDTLVGYSLTPGFRGVINAPEYTTAFSVNSDGNRDVEHPLIPSKNTYRILGLGDSFSMGMGVEYEDMFWTQLEQRANTSSSRRVEVIKTGVGGYDALEESLYLRDRGMKYKPDLVVLEVYENDFSTKTKVSDGPHIVNGYLATSKPEKFSVRDFVFRHMRSWGYIAAKIRALPMFAHKSGEDGTLHFEMDVTQKNFTNPETQKILNTTFGFINQMNEIAKKGGSKFAVVAVPGSYRIDPERREKLMQQYGLKSEETDFYKHYKLLEDLGKQNGFPVLNLGTILESAPKDPLLYYASDQHFTKTGSHIAGEAIEKFLRFHKLLP